MLISNGTKATAWFQPFWDIIVT